MTPTEYLDAVKERLLTDPFVAAFGVRRERHTATDAHIRARLLLSDGSSLEFSEYAVRTAQGDMHVVDYSYHWATAENELICRWDNAPHFPNLPGFPHHYHDGQTGDTLSGKPLNIYAVLDLIDARLSASSQR